ncbi:MAG: B12-binding domain-containing radical SAM protein [Planctomycetes bacterium]|nr:B12-binding domain-containing radical SAM protein [Planctomycetota bacterium]
MIHSLSSRRRIRFIEPQGRPDRPLNAWITRWPLLGGITLATILEQSGYDVVVYNENISGPVDADPKIYADLCNADVVGIGIMTPTASRGYAIADRIKRDAAGVKIVIGGVHATVLPEEALAHADIVVCGEGETVIEAIASGEVDSGIIQATALADLDQIPTLNHFLMHDFDKLLAGCRKRYLYELPVMTSRGCPYGCRYCSVTRMFGRKVRRQSVEKVHRDLCRYAEQGFTTLFFYDDNFTTDRQWTRTLLDRIRPMRLRFNAQSRVDFHWIDGDRRQRDDQMLRSMHRAGGDMLFIGYETTDEATAKAWNKGYRGPQSLSARLSEDTKILHDNGFWIHGMFVMGPEHTARTAEGIVDFARRTQIETLQVSVLTPLPGTPMYDDMRPHLIFTDYPSDWDYYDGVHCVYNHSRLGVAGLQKAVFEAHRRFYLCGGWGGRTLRSLAARPISFTDKVIDLWQGARTAKTLLGKWQKETETFLDVVRARTQG